jgi:hypothetical protein
MFIIFKKAIKETASNKVETYTFKPQSRKHLPYSALFVL